MKLLTLTLMVCAIAEGCESTPHYNRTKVAVIRQFPKRPYGSVELFENKDDVKKPYEVIAYMSIDGKAGGRGRLYEGLSLSCRRRWSRRRNF